MSRLIRIWSLADVDLRGYLTQGYFCAKTGQIVSGATAWIASSVFILAGPGMMAWPFGNTADSGAES